MNKQARSLLVLNLCMTVGIALCGCGGKNKAPATPAFPLVLAERTVAVAGGGGGANVAFSGNKGWSIRITLTATDSATVPYGFLESEPGTGVYQPPQDTARNGHNSVVLTLSQTGAYTLTVFDATNRGGTVSAKVERLS